MANIKKEFLIACYGTLKRGRSNNHILHRAEFIGETKTEEKFDLYDFGHFPALVENGEKNITVEIFKVDEITLAMVDALEGYNNINPFYDRKTINTEFGDAYLYIIKDPKKYNSLVKTNLANW